MSIRAPFRIWLLTLICVSLLMVHGGGAHLHLCFDGGEPPVTFHLEDSGVHHQDTGVSAPHQDQEVVLADEAIGKFSKFNLDLPVLLIAALLVWVLLQGQSPSAPNYRKAFFLSGPRSLRPPLRGPPLLISH